MSKINKVDKQLQVNIREVILLIQEAHDILNEMKVTKYQDMFVKSADSNLVYALNDLVHFEEKL